MKIKKNTIEFSEAGFPQIVLDYIARDKFLDNFYTLPPEIESFEKLFNTGFKRDVDRKILTDCLRKQYAVIEDVDWGSGEFNYTSKNSSTKKKGHPNWPGPKVSANIDLLEKENTYTVTTGHQLNLFTGPLYSIYKIITTILLAERLAKKFPQNNFVPVFWMATEDHDLEEIKSVNIFGKKLDWDTDQMGATGRMSTAGINTLLDELDELMGKTPEAEYLLELFSNAYGEKRSLGESTRLIMDSLFGKYGLVCIDGDDVVLKKSFTKIMLDDILNETNFSIIDSTNLRLSEHYKTQVNPREINLFYLLGSIRERLVRDGDLIKVLNTDISFTQEEITEAITENPEQFSPNVVLRPLYQEFLLPGIAMVGGPAEVSYWLEFREMFLHHGVPFPILFLRNSVMWVDEQQNRKLRKNGMKAEDMFLETNDLIREFVTRHEGENLSMEQERRAIQNQFEALALKAAAVDPTLKSTVDAEMQRVQNALDGIGEKLMRAQKRKMETNINQVRSLREKLFPDGQMQERFDNFIPYYLKYGVNFFHTLKENFEPFDSHFIILTDDGDS